MIDYVSGDNLRTALREVNNRYAKKTQLPGAYQGPTADLPGVQGLVPSATAQEADKFLKADGTWAVPEKGIELNDALEKSIELYYAMRRTPDVYKVRLPLFAANPATKGEKLLANAGLQHAPSTDTVEGVDDYEHIPLFEWVHCNYVRAEDGSPRPIAIKGTADYKESGSVDVGAMQMSFYWKVETNEEEGYQDIAISALPQPEDGWEIWPECRTADGRNLPWCIGSAYFSGIATDGLPRSQPGLPVQNFVSHDTILKTYPKKGVGYQGGGIAHNTFAIVFTAIKNACKNSQEIYMGCCNYNFQYSAAVEAQNLPYFPVTADQAANVLVGSSVAVGYGSKNTDGTLNVDRGSAIMRSTADKAKVTAVTRIDETIWGVYLEGVTNMDTTAHDYGDGITAPKIISSMPWGAGSTDAVIKHHDGSYSSNTSGKTPFRVQGREYMVGAWSVASDTVMVNNPDYTKDIYTAPVGVKHSSNEAVIKSTYRKAGTCGKNEANTDFWIGDLGLDTVSGAWWPKTVGTGDKTGTGDRFYYGAATSGVREYLMGGNLGAGSAAGLACLYGWVGLGSGSWYYVARD